MRKETTEYSIAVLLSVLSFVGLYMLAADAELSIKKSAVPEHDVLGAFTEAADKPAQFTAADAVPESQGSLHVPFYSQFVDISDPAWKKLGCGIADLAMLIEYYKPGAVSVDTLLMQGIASGAFIHGAGWSHAGLVLLSERYGLTGSAHDVARLSTDDAFGRLKAALREGPVIASVYYTFTPGHPIPHLVVINNIEGNTVYYNDPSESEGGGSITVERFKSAWKKRYITVRPVAHGARL